MTQQSRNGNARVVCLFCGARTFVPASATRDVVNQLDSGPGISIIRCHVCGKEAPYSASEIFVPQEVSLHDGNARTRAAAL
jgi:transcription elongation factor Elf1